MEAKISKDNTLLSIKDAEVAITDDTVQFKIKKTARSLSGKYQIKLTNGQGEDIKMVSIIFEDVPQPPKDVNIYDIYQTKCKIKFTAPEDDGGTPIIKYIIEYQDVSRKKEWQTAAEIKGGDEYITDINDLIPKKQYKFRIRAINKIGSSEPGTFKNVVLAKDPWDEPGQPNNVELTDWDRDHADLKWDAPDTDGGDTITAYIIEFKDKFSNDWTFGNKVSGDHHYGTVEGLKEKQQYEFRVRAVNRAGPGEPSKATKSIIAKSRFVKPFIVGPGLQDITIKKGQTLRYDIKYDGEPEPKPTWFKGTNEISFDNLRIVLEQLERNSCITIKKAMRKDSSKYKLVLTNSSGTITSEGQVIILDSPSQPNGPFEAEEIRARHIQMKWRHPEDDGGCEITGYSLEKLDEESGRWISAGEVGPNVTSFNFKGLTAGKKYRFRVRAINKEGESEALETTDSILAKNPYDPPKPPSKAIIEDYDNKAAVLGWNAPISDGGRPVLYYIIEQKDKFCPNWVEVFKTDNDSTKCTIEGLKEKNVYQFRIRAVNKAGTSEPSDPTDNHLCKHKNCEFKPTSTLYFLRIVLL